MKIKIATMQSSRLFLIGLFCALASCQESKQKEAAQALEDAAEEFREDTQKELENGSLSVENPVDYSKLNDALDKAGESASGQGKLAMDLAKYSLKHMADIMAPLTSASAGLGESLDYSGVEKKEDIDVLSEKVRNYREINAEVKAAFGSELYVVLHEHADKIGLEGDARSGFFTGFKSKFRQQSPLLQKVRDQDDALCETILKQHEILKDSFGKWQWSEDLESVEFSDDVALAKYNLTLEELDKTASEQEETQREILNVR